MKKLNTFLRQTTYSVLVKYPYLHDKNIQRTLGDVLSTKYEVCGRQIFNDWCAGYNSRASLVQREDKQQRIIHYYTNFSNTRKEIFHHLFKYVENPLESYTLDSLQNVYYGNQLPSVLTKNTMNNAFYHQDGWDGLLGMVGQSEEICRGRDSK